MRTLLRIDSSALGADASFSRQLTDEFVQHWRQTNPDGKMITRDLAMTNIPPINEEWVATSSIPEASLTSGQKDVIGLSEALIAELHAADEYVVGVAMYNFSIPAALKLWIDQVVRPAKTFVYEKGAPVGLLRGKKAVFFAASGGVYAEGTPMAAMNFVEPYLRLIFGFMGVVDATFINSGGTIQLRYGVSREMILEPALRAIEAQFKMGHTA